MKKKSASKTTPSNTPKKSASKTTSDPAQTSAAGGNVNDKLRIRMYRVGFGDFFLVTVPSAAGPQHIIIDCGVTRGKTGEGDIGTIKQAVANMASETGGKLALIIMTHRHMDHIIGFSRCPEFKNFKGKVDAIWMPVWENEYDPNASKFQAALASIALDAQKSLAMKAEVSDDDRELAAMMENATGEEGASGGILAAAGPGTGGGSNAASLQLLKQGLGVKPEYYCKGDTPKLPKSLADAGLTAEILGPPPVSEDAFMKLMDLKKGVGQYLDARSQSNGDGKRTRLFRRSFECQPGDYGHNPEETAEVFREWWPHRDIGAAPDDKAWQRLKAAVEAAQPTAPLTAAKQLDSFLNNQSLVVLFTFRGKKLLFAGDAQAGNWEDWLYDSKTPSTTPSETVGALGKSVLGTLDFYKVGHHGSTNATPIAAVQAMTNSKLVAMCSTQAHSFGSEDKGTEVPRKPLLDALAKKSALVRSDQIAVKLDGKQVPPAEGAPASIPSPATGAGAFKPGSGYVDYLL